MLATLYHHTLLTVWWYKVADTYRSCGKVTSGIWSSDTCHQHACMPQRPPYPQMHFFRYHQGLPCAFHSTAHSTHAYSPSSHRNPTSCVRTPPHMPAGGASPRHIQQRLSHLSTGRQHARVTLSAAAVTAWLGAHPAAASGIASLSLDLSHHGGSSDFDTASLDRLLQKLPKVTRVTMAGAVEGTDAYEPIGGCAAGDRSGGGGAGTACHPKRCGLLAGHTAALN